MRPSNPRSPETSGARRLLAALERPGATWIALCGVLVVLTLFGAAGILMSADVDPARRLVLVVSNALAHLSYALLAPVLLHVLERHPFRRGPLLRPLGWHLLTALALGGAAVLVMQFGLHFTVRPLASAEAVLLRTGHTLRYNLHDIFFVYALLAGTAGALDLFRRERRRDLSAVELERELATAKLEVLRAQLDPHFIFKTLSALLPLIRKRPEAACDAIVRLGTLLRLSFRSAPSGLVRLREEEEFLRCFLGIEEMRVSDRLSVLVDFSPEVLDAAVPALVLKPFVESALQAGVFRRPGPALLEVTARRAGDDVVVRVRSRSPGDSDLESSPVPDPETDAACERLERTFGRRQTVRILWNGPGDLEATLRFPHTALPPRPPGGQVPPLPSSGSLPKPNLGRIRSRSAPLLDRPARLTAIAAVLWLVSGLYFGSQEHLRAGPQPGQEPPPVLSFYLPPLVHSSIWILLTPGVLLLYRLLPLTRRPHVAIPVHLAAAASAAALVVVLERPFAAVELPGNAGTYVLLVAVLLVLDVARQARAAELRSASLEAQLTDARLATLRTQLHPHFLFNTLNGLLPLVTLDPEAASRVLVQLGDLLRATFGHDLSQIVPLASEVDFLRRYLEIEAIRFRDRLTVRFDVAEGTLDAVVPRLVLQPLVENAIKHGVSRRPGPGTLALSSRRDGAALVVEIRNDAADDDRPPRPDGVGIANTRARISQIYGTAASLEAGREGVDAFLTVLRVPWSTSETRGPAPA